MPAFTVDQAFEIALQHHRAGRFTEAESIYRQILESFPNDPDALYLLGLIAHQRGEYRTAVELISRAIAGNSSVADFHNNLGIALAALGSLDEAIRAYQRAIEIHPAFAGALNNLGNALERTGRVTEAETFYRRAIALCADDPTFHVNLGNACKSLGRYDEAIAAYDAALKINPRLAVALNNLGNVFKTLGQVGRAIEAYHSALAIDPSIAKIHVNLGSAFKDQGRLDEAAATYQTALQLDPGLAEAFNNLGNVLKDQARIDEACDCYRNALELDPRDAEVHSNLVYCMHFDPRCDPRLLFEEHRRWNDAHAAPLAPLIRSHENDRDPDRRLKIGYVSPDFADHAVARFLLPLLENHDHERYEIFCYAAVSKPDWVTERFRGCADVWRNIFGCPDEDIANLIRGDRIDVLVDLAAHSCDNRLLTFAHKPAPAQVTYLAYPSTTGLDAMDYRFTDPYLDPRGEPQEYYSETSIWLPDTYWCYQSFPNAPDVGPLPSLEKGHLTFGSLNNFSKLSDRALRVWCQLLLALPGSRLLHHAHEGSHRERVRAFLAGHGIDPQRLSFAGRKSTVEYLDIYGQIDIGLDPFPYGGGTTTCDALWMGVPVVSLAEKMAVSRSGLSILSVAGLPELVATSEDEYRRITIDLAKDQSRLVEMRARLRSQMQESPLMDARRFARNIENAYREMWRKWCAAPSSSG